MPGRMRYIVQDQIEKCDKALQNNDTDAAEKLCDEIISAYGTYINNIKDGLDMFWISGSDNPTVYLDDLKKLKMKLELFESRDCLPINSVSSRNPSINIDNKINSSNTNTNTISNTVNLEVLFKETKKEIEGNGYLPPEEIQEILKKIDEIKEIHISQDSKNNKWLKLRDIVGWTSTKGITIAASILNLITVVLKATN